MVPGQLPPRKIAIAPEMIATCIIASRTIASKVITPNEYTPLTIASWIIASRKIAPQITSHRIISSRTIARNTIDPRQISQFYKYSENETAKKRRTSQEQIEYGIMKQIYLCFPNRQRLTRFTIEKAHKTFFKKSVMSIYLNFFLDWSFFP